MPEISEQPAPEPAGRRGCGTDVGSRAETGLEKYTESEMLALCSKTIRENNYENDDFLTYVCFELFKKKQYDKVILTYLAKYYCGATTDMKWLWREAKNMSAHP